MNASTEGISAPIGRGHDIKIYGHFYVEGKIDHRVLFDYFSVAGETEKDAAMKAMEAHRKGDNKHYIPTHVEVGGCRQFPGCGTVYFSNRKQKE